MMYFPTPWKARLAAMDHSNGTSNKMIQTAMLNEIADLRAALTTLRNGVQRYERRSERMIASLENKIRKLKGRS